MAREIPLTRGMVAIVDDEDYEGLAGFRWHASSPRGNVAYARRSFWRSGKTFAVLMHRAIIEVPAGQEIDHINRDGLDNRRSNLRLCTHQQNMANTIPTKQSLAGYRGVAKATTKRGFVAGVGDRYVGIYDTAEDAARAYDAAALEQFGEFAVLNFPGEISVAPPTRPRNPASIWTDAEIAALTVAAERGDPITWAADRIGRGRNAARRMADQLNLIFTVQRGLRRPGNLVKRLRDGGCI